MERSISTGSPPILSPTQPPVTAEQPVVEDQPVAPKKGKVRATGRAEECTTVVHRSKPTLEQLTLEANQERDQIDGLQRKEAVHAFRAGALLVRIQNQLKTAGGWCSWQNENNWNRGTAARYIKLFKSVKNESRLKDLTIMEAEAKFCTKKSKKQKKQLPEPNPNGGESQPSNKSPVALARDHVALGLIALSEMRHGERRIDQEELSDLKKLLNKTIEVVEELETKAVVGDASSHSVRSVLRPIALAFGLI